MNIVYKIKRISDNKYYNGRSSFTSDGRYFSYNSTKQILKFLSNKYNDGSLILVCFVVDLAIECIDLDVANKLIMREYIFREYINNII